MHEATQQRRVHDHLISSYKLCSRNTVKNDIGVQQSKDIQYLQSAKRIRQITSERMMNVFYWSNFLFSLTQRGRELKARMNDIREFARTVIQEKKNDFLCRDGSADMSKGNRKALMDFLIEKHLVTQELSDEDIREEVDTFVAAV